jgi:hypothetical protein
MKVFFQPTGLHSRAMLRVARALQQYAPEHVEAVTRPEVADLRIVHVIGHGSLEGVDPKQPRVLIQYCLKSTEDGGMLENWLPIWKASRLVWSYYRLDQLAAWPDIQFFHAPLGVDSVFTAPLNGTMRDIGVITSGYVSESEGIEEVAIAAYLAGMRVVHIGPGNVVRHPPTTWTAMEGISDLDLSHLYHRSVWVSGLRHCEGFELPALEGLASGARPIVFDRDDMRQWYRRHAVFVPECSGNKLVGHLLDVFRRSPTTVTKQEQLAVLGFFDWARIASEFWKRLEGISHA